MLSLSFLDRIVQENVYEFSDVVVIDPLTDKTYPVPGPHKLSMPLDPTDEELEERIQFWIQINIFIPKRLRLPVVAFTVRKEEPCETLAACGC